MTSNFEVPSHVFPSVSTTPISSCIYHQSQEQPRVAVLISLNLCFQCIPKGDTGEKKAKVEKKPEETKTARQA